MAKFKPFHVLTGSGTQEVGNLVEGTVRMSAYDGTATVLIGYIGSGETFHEFQDPLASQVAPFDVVVDAGKGTRLAVQYDADVTISVAGV